MLLFDPDESDLTLQAEALLDNAAEYYRSCGYSWLTSAGHADRSGAADYNLALSRRRAERVRSYLAGRGVLESALAIQAFGESRPLVKTADGVDEPQNRRVK